MTTVEGAVAAALAAAGTGIGYALAAARMRAASERARRETEAHAAAAASLADDRLRQITQLRESEETLRQSLSRSEAARVAGETRVTEAERHLSEQRQLLDSAQDRLQAAFKALAADALEGSSVSLMRLAEQAFRTLREQASGDLAERQSAIERLVGPLSETLARLRDETRQMESQRREERGALDERLRGIANAESALQSETARLVNALKSPNVRGRWGEITLRKTAELAGMTLHCDFVEQESATTEDGRFRPDMIVRLPGGREVVVDSKVPLAGFLDALEAPGEPERSAALGRHAAQLRAHVDRLSEKGYWQQFRSTPEFVVLFVPNDSFLAAAAEKDPEVVERALGRNVVIATPATFIALLRAVAFGWRQEQLAENSAKISELGRTLFDRISVFTAHLAGVGTGIGRAVRSYNEAVASLTSRVLPAARQFRPLGVEGTKEKEIEDPPPVDSGVVPLPAAAIGDGAPGGASGDD